jgi:hypothetical protein
VYAPTPTPGDGEVLVDDAAKLCSATRFPSTGVMERSFAAFGPFVVSDGSGNIEA